MARRGVIIYYLDLLKKLIENVGWGFFTAILFSPITNV
jgi:hypothetical protein